MTEQNKEKIDGIKIVPNPTQDELGARQLVDYRKHREKMLEWLLNEGKNPDENQGYSSGTIKRRAYRIDQFYRWVWKQEGKYTTQITQRHADDYIEELAYNDDSNSHKDKVVKSLKSLFKWRKHEYGGELWSPDRTFSTETYQPQDYFTMEERKKLREAALEYGSIPAYNNLDPDERDRWKAYLSQRLMKPKSEVSPQDWKKANGWKIPSLVWVSLDAGLRPVEVERAVTSWVDLDNGVLRIPKDESSKNRENWIVGLRDETAEALDEWLKQRRNFDEYNGSDKLWLTREGNPYQTSSLQYILNRLCEIAGIETSNRKISWYAIRHSVGTYMTHEEDLGAAKAQLRHKSEKTTLQYDQTPVEKRKDALDRMG